MSEDQDTPKRYVIVRRLGPDAKIPVNKDLWEQYGVPPDQEIQVITETRNGEIFDDITFKQGPDGISGRVNNKSDRLPGEKPQE